MNIFTVNILLIIVLYKYYFKYLRLVMEYYFYLNKRSEIINMKMIKVHFEAQKPQQ